MLLCLDREQRLIYVLGEIFGVTDTVGAELLDTSPDNFRQRLARARRDLHSFMNDKCGLVNQANPCRCARKTAGFIANPLAYILRTDASTRVVFGAASSAARISFAVFSARRMNGSSESRLSVSSREQCSQLT